MVTRSNYLLDTHAFLWWALLDARLSPKVTAILEDPRDTIFLSAVTCWEIVTKYRLGKLAIPADLAAAVEVAANAAGFGLMNITFAHAQRTGLLPIHHKDPFDRLLIAQALEEGLVLLSRDREFDAYGVERVWG